MNAFAESSCWPSILLFYLITCTNRTSTRIRTSTVATIRNLDQRLENRHEMFRIEDGGRKGRSAIANRDIARGEQILAEHPILVVFDHATPNFEANELSGNSQLTRQAITLQSPRWRTDKAPIRFTDSALGRERNTGNGRRSPTGQDLDNIRRLLTNSFHLPEISREATPATPESAHVVFGLVSMANHSCQPNTGFEWNPALLPDPGLDSAFVKLAGMGALHALQPISKGAEITIAY